MKSWVKGFERAEKIKKYFIWKLKKDSYLCTPNDNEGKTNRNGGCRKGLKKD